MNTTTEEQNALADVAPLILAGDGYQLTIAPEAEAKKTELLATSSGVMTVRTNDESADAQGVIRSLASMRLIVEKSRKLVKDPVIKVGKMIDAAAAEFLATIEAEETRIKKLVGDHAVIQARAAAAAAAEERRLAAEAKAAREAAEEKATAAANTGNIADVIAAKQAEASRQEAMSARLDAADETAATRLTAGVRFTIDFTVADAGKMLTRKPELASVSVRRMETLAWLKDLAARDIDIVEIGAAHGIDVFKKPVVASR